MNRYEVHKSPYEFQTNHEERNLTSFSLFIMKREGASALEFSFA